MKFDKSTVFGNQTPFYFDASVKDIYSTIKCGATLEIIPKKFFGMTGRLFEYLVEKKNKHNFMGDISLMYSSK